MKRLRYLQILICFLLSVSIHTGPLAAQMPQRGGGNQVSIQGWTDDTHYLIRTFENADKKAVIQNVDIKTGKFVYSPPVKFSDGNY